MEYKPSFLDHKNNPIQATSAWVGLEKIIRPIVVDFGLKTKNALEIGVDYGYSLSALSNIFDSVVGVDNFLGDVHAGHRNEYQYDLVIKNFSGVRNVQIIKSSYQEYFDALCDDQKFDMIHIDIIHTYEDTYDCGMKALGHANCILFHDTESFPSVKKACEDISSKSGYSFYNYPFCHGLGILINEK